MQTKGGQVWVIGWGPATLRLNNGNFAHFKKLVN